MQQQIDVERAKAFGERLFGLYSGGIMTFMVEIGHRTGLFEAAARGPTTSEELAERSGLNERYVREWLGAVTTGGILEYDRASGRYTLPPEHAVCLTGRTAFNMAPISQMASALGKQVDAVTRSFRHGGGVPYSEFGTEFTDLLDEGGRYGYDLHLVRAYLPMAKGLPERLAEGISVADIGCGTGHCVNLMAQAYPRSMFVGYDLAEHAIAKARAEAHLMGLTNTRFEVMDAAQLPPEPKFGLITAFDSIHDQVAPAEVLRRIEEALTPDGTFFMVDIKASSDVADNLGNPMAPLLYGLSVLHCMTVSLAYGGAGLGTVWGEQLARQMLAEAGFADVQVRDAPDPMNSVYVCRRGPPAGP